MGTVLRFLASGGMADEDSDVVAGLLAVAHRLADQVIADPGAAAEVKTTAREFLAGLAADTLGDH